MPCFQTSRSQPSRKLWGLNGSELDEAAEGALHQAPVPWIAAVRDSGYRLVQIHITLAPLTEAIRVLSLSHEIFIFKTLVLELEMSMLKVLGRMENSLL